MTHFSAKPNVLFLAQRFDAKSYANSGAFQEIVSPMSASGLLGDVKVHSWGKDSSFSHRYVAGEVATIKDKIGNNAVIIYGAGAHSEEFIHELFSLNVVAFSDTNEMHWGRNLFGLPVISPDEISSRTKYVVTSSRNWDQEITRQLNENYPELSVFSLYDQLVKQNGGGLHQQIDSVLKQFAPDQFDLVFYCPASPAEAFNDEHFERIRGYFKAKLATVWWDYDDSNPTNDYMQFERCSLRWSDIVVDPGNFSKNERLKKNIYPFHLHSDVNKIHVLPTAYDLDVFSPKIKDWSKPIAMFGSIIGERIKWKTFLEKCYSSQFRHIGGVNRGQKLLSMEEYAELMMHTPIIVNTQTYNFLSQCKGRVREILSCASLLLEQDNPETRTFFADYRDIDYFNDTSELSALLDYYLSHPQQALERAISAHQWYLANWSARPWTEKFLLALEDCGS